MNVPRRSIVEPAPTPPEQPGPVDLRFDDMGVRDEPVAEVAGDRAPGAEEVPADRTESRRLDRTESKALLARLATLDPDDTARAEIRERLVRLHLPLVEYLARRFRNRGEPLDDLVQVGTIGLIKSIDRFDLERGVEFSTYATPTIVGEIKRHFRDKGWAVRVPRRLQELRLQLDERDRASWPRASAARPRSPSSPSALGVSEEEVLEGLESANAYSHAVPRRPGRRRRRRPAVADTLGDRRRGPRGRRDTASRSSRCSTALPAREKRILLLRFFGDMTQSQIAERARHLPDARVPAARPHPRPAPRGAARRGLMWPADVDRLMWTACERAALTWRVM